jgi:hypothetical protein
MRLYVDVIIITDLLPREEKKNSSNIAFLQSRNVYIEKDSKVAQRAAWTRDLRAL